APRPATAVSGNPSIKERSVARSVEEKPKSVDHAAPPAAAEIDASRVEMKQEHRGELLRLYRQMLMIRRFEERAQVAYTKATLGGYCHLNLGEEATLVGG